MNAFFKCDFKKKSVFFILFLHVLQLFFVHNITLKFSRSVVITNLKLPLKKKSQLPPVEHKPHVEKHFKGLKFLLTTKSI